MYSLNDPLTKVKGIGPKLNSQFQEQGINNIAELLLYLPLRYEDRSQLTSIDDLKTALINGEEISKFVTLRAEVSSCSQYYRNRLLLTRASIDDGTGKLKCLWFNNKFIKSKLEKGVSYFFSGHLDPQGTLMQAVVEEAKEETIHTNRLVPIYSGQLQLKQGSLRRILKEVISNLAQIDEAKQINQLFSQAIGKTLPNLREALQQLHFPSEEEKVIAAREKLALEEILSLIKKSQTIKKNWQKTQNALPLKLTLDIPKSIPFTLTQSQKTACNEIFQDLKQKTPMNRLLVGDVGTGKTVVAGLAAYHTVLAGHNACLIAPTQILTQQHAQTISQFFPKINIKILTAKTSKKNRSQQPTNKQATFYIGTHAVINRLAEIKPALVIYDEQHRFGVKQRSKIQKLDIQPHILTMTATPIPRTLMLTIFSHLSLSLLDEFPQGKRQVKSWLLPEKKRSAALQWLFKELSQASNKLALFVCPFINPSKNEAFEHVASAKDSYQQIKKQAKELNIALLHGRLKEKDRVIKQLFQGKIQLLVTTPVIEVGVDLPQANIIIIENAERFGLASLHQLRGRVGRQGQQAYCLLFTSRYQASRQRLQLFCQEDDGQKLAEFDLKNRGAGNLFGTEQHGFESLRFASWANLELIKNARQIYQALIDKQLDWQSRLSFHSNDNAQSTPAAN